MTNKERFYPEARFGGFTDIDGTVAFFNRVNALLQPSFVVLDVGCGRGAFAEDPVLLKKNLRILTNKVSKVIGIDVDQRAEHNPYVDEFRLITGDSWPVDSNSIDLVVADNVLEHVSQPNQFFCEIHRVLKDARYACIRTPNRWSYIAIGATLIPNKYHANVTSVVQDRRKAEDVFPTCYKCNSIWKIRRTMKGHGFECVVYGYEAEPSYLSFSNIAYRFGVMHQRLAPGFLKPALFAFGKIRKG